MFYRLICFYQMTANNFVFAPERKYRFFCCSRFRLLKHLYAFERKFILVCLSGNTTSSLNFDIVGELNWVLLIKYANRKKFESWYIEKRVRPCEVRKWLLQSFAIIRPSLRKVELYILYWNISKPIQIKMLLLATYYYCLRSRDFNVSKISKACLCNFNLLPNN